MTRRPLTQKLRQLGEQSFPTTAVFEVTRRCNAHCGFCYIDKSAVEDLDTIEVKSIIDKLSESGILFLTITGGEPYMRQDIDDILTYAVSKDFFQIDIMTNGIVMQEKNIEFLANHTRHIRGISLSFFSSEESTNDAFFGVSGATAKILQTAKKLQGLGLRVLMKMQLQKENEDTFTQTMEMLIKEGFFVKTQPNVYLNAHTDASRYGCYNQPEHIQKYYQLLQSNPFTKKILDAQEPLSNDCGTTFCQGIRTMVYIDSAGTVRPCVSFSDVSLGSLRGDQSLQTILQTSSERKKLQTFRQEQIEKCRNCRFLGTCSPCLGDVYCTNADLSEPPPAACHRMEVLEKLGIQ